MIKEKNTETKSINKVLRDISIEELKHFGLNRIGYVKHVKNSPQKAFHLFAADGKKLGTAKSKEKLDLIVFEAELNTVTLH